MSGFVTGLGKPGKQEIAAMFETMGHRGPHASGTWQESGRIIMAQNCLWADGAAKGEFVPVRLEDPGKPGLTICYDGQMGNWSDLAAREGVADGAFREERLLMRLFRSQGMKMFDLLGDAIFAFVLWDGESILAARDLLGIKTLFYGWKDSTLYLASELKSLVKVTDDVHEFPPGHVMTGKGEIRPFAVLPSTPPPQLQADVEAITARIRDIIDRSMRSRVDFSRPTGSLLSGGLDSSVIGTLASRMLGKIKPGERLRTFALGVGESEDIRSARIMAEFLGTDHKEIVVDLDRLVAALPEVIYYLESFDPSLVRSSVSNFLVSKVAREQGMEVLLSGEGGDEVFCGYQYLKDFPKEELFARQMECIGFLHSNASLRLDRMNQANSIKVVAPLISGELLEYSLAIPPELKQRPDEAGGKTEKWIFRKAYEKDLPREIAWRLKQEFSQGSGSAAALPGYFDKVVTDRDFSRMKARHPILRSKEELYYFRLFTEHFPCSRAVETVGQWVSC